MALIYVHLAEALEYSELPSFYSIFWDCKRSVFTLLVLGSNLLLL